ncbi:MULTISPECIES: acyloxyacyl hydrolase [Acidobacteriaceae]|uniref:acyloxyacyl hydrolase n=1 Tax=Acidobacteriaceae TaxID=204434 RepID=UPI0020B10E7E|nr:MULTISPECIES: acyloxyacyl hydrolase [Acidobacteriaceae]MDW5266484.1 acyloxyacyl hydrolase [Edaphobacter sp.]
MTKGFRGIARPLIGIFALALSAHFATAQALATNSDANPFHANSGKLPLELGVLVQSGVGLTEDRNSFKFLMAGVHAGKVLTGDYLPGPLHGNFEYAVEVFPFWQSYTPKFQRANCTTAPNSPDLSCSPLYTVGGTYSGISITPIILRWNFTGTRRISPWIQGAGGVLWTNHKYPAFGGQPLSVFNDGPNTDASVWNFTPQGGVGVHYFLRPRRSIDFGANAVHISSASLGDKNPGVNASVQFTIGYSWWK